MLLGSATPPVLVEWGTNGKNLLGNLYNRAHGMRNSNQVLHDDHTILGLTMPPALAKHFSVMNAGMPSVCGITFLLYQSIKGCYTNNIFK